MRFSTVALMNVRILRRKPKVELAKVAIGVAKIRGALQAAHRSSALVESMGAIHRVARSVTLVQMAAVVVDMAMVLMEEVSLETRHPSTGKQVRRQKCRGDSLQTMEEVILTASAPSQPTTWISQKSASNGLH